MKKWTYLAVAGMLLGSAPVFTGCIDNDEPAGITDLRGAKAELLRAKAAVEAAKVAEVEAQAALLRAQAAVEEANAVKVQAEAEKVRAEAAIAQAKADYINAKTEEAKAQAQAIIDENERKQAEWEEQAAVRAAQAEAAIKQAQLATAEALVKYQTVVAALQDAKNKALEPYIAKLETATKDYYGALDALRQAQRDYNNQVAENEESEASKDLKTRDLQREVMLKQRGYDGAVAALDRAKAELEEAKALEPHELAVKYDEVLEEKYAIQKEIADLSVQAAEEAVTIYNEQVIPYKNLQKEISELKDEPQTMAAVEFDFSGDGSGYPAYVQRGVFKYEEGEYTYNDQYNLEVRKRLLKFWVNEFKGWTRDANDNAWTNDAIGNLEGQIKAKEDYIKTLKASWQEAINAYQLGIYNEVDPSKITGYTAVTEDIASYNESAAAYNENNKSIATLIKQRETDYDALIAVIGGDGVVGSATETYNTTMGQIAEKYNAIDAEEEWNTRLSALNQEKATATTAFEAAEAALEALEGSTDVDAIEAAEAAVDAARRRLEAVETAIGNCTLPNIIEELANERAEEEGAALQQKLTAEKTAQDAYDAKWGTAGTETTKLTAAQKSVADLLKAVSAAVDELVKSSEAYNKNLSEINPIDINMIKALDSPKYDSELGYETVKADLDTKIIELNKDNLLYTIQIRSGLLYGQEFGENVYGDNIAQVVELTDAQILAKVDEAMDVLVEGGTDITLYHYLNECRKYGAAGERLALMEQVRIAKTWLNNADIVNAKINQAEAALKALTDGFDALEASIEAKEEEAELALETLQADLKDTYTEVEAKRQELKPLDGLLAAIGHAIEDYENANEDVWTEDGIKALISELEAQIKDLELAVFDAQTLLLTAQDNLAKWNSDSITWLEVLAQRIEDAQINVDRKKAKLDQVQDALDAVIAALVNDPTAEVPETPATPQE